MIWFVIVLLAVAGWLNGVRLHQREQLRRVLAVLDEWDALSKGESPTTERIRAAIDGSSS